MVKQAVISCVIALLLIECPNPVDIFIQEDVARRTNATLAALTISPGTLSPLFDSDTFSYAATVDNTVTSITVTPTKAQSGAKIEVRVNDGARAEVPSGSMSEALNLNVGDNTVEIHVTAEVEMVLRTYTIIVHRMSKNAFLSGLTISEGALSPDFDSNTANYTVRVPNATASVSVIPTAAHAKATIRVQVNGGKWQTGGSGIASQSLSLEYRDNPILIEVTAEEGESNMYCVTVHRIGNDASLLALSVSMGELNPPFNSGTTNYSLTVPVSGLTLTPTTSDSLSIIQVRVGSGSWESVSSGFPSTAINLSIGANTVDVWVTAEDGSTTMTYTIAVYRQHDNAELSDLTLSSGTLDPAFSTGTTSYSTIVSKDTSSVAVTPTKADPLASIEVQVNGAGWQAVSSGDASDMLVLNPGLNTIEIRLTAQNQTTKSYMIKIIRGYDGLLDKDFLSTGSGANDGVLSLAVQSDGKIIIGGRFTSYQATSRGYVSRLLSDGILDTAFLTAGSGANGSVYTTTLQTDQKILIGGYFTSYNGISMNHVARLDTDGSLDSSFLVTGSGANNSVYCFAVQTDGKILIGGSFTSYNGTPAGRVARLDTDGNLDSSFLATGSGANDSVYCISVQTDGKILIGGYFTSFAGIARNTIARLNMDGSLDTSFPASGIGANGYLYSMAVQTDGRILIGGGLTEYNGTAQGYLARLETDGSLDSGFVANPGADNPVLSISVQPDGRILIGGNFTAYNGTPQGYISRLNIDGSLDTSFLPIGTGFNNFVDTITLQADGKILIGGWFTRYNGIDRAFVIRIWGD
jgi:uncharacterized delta-60 repeat protein